MFTWICSCVPLNCVFMAARQLCCRPPAITLYRCRLDLSVLSFFRRLIYEVVWSIVTKLCHIFEICKIRSEIWVAPPPEIWRSQNIKISRDFGELRGLIANISGTQQDIVNPKTALKTTDNTPAQANLIWCTLVHKRLKIGPTF